MRLGFGIWFVSRRHCRDGGKGRGSEAVRKKVWGKTAEAFLVPRQDRNPIGSGMSFFILQIKPGARTSLINWIGVRIGTPKGLPRASKSRSLVTRAWA